MIPRPGTGHIQELTFGIVDVFQIRIVSDRLDSGLKRQNVVIAGRDHHHFELQSFRLMHGHQSYLPRFRIGASRGHGDFEPRSADRSLGST